MQFDECSLEQSGVFSSSTSVLWVTCYSSSAVHYLEFHTKESDKQLIILCLFFFSSLNAADPNFFFVASPHKQNKIINVRQTHGMESFSWHI